MSPNAFAAKPRTGPLGKPVGLQLWTIRDDVAKDLPAALKAVAAIGYGEVEFAGIPKAPAAEVRTMLRDNGLTAPSMHCGMTDAQTDLQQRIDFAQAVGARYIMISFPSTADARFKDGNALAAGMTLDDWKWNAEQLNRIGELTRKAGITCGYHNHNMEFRSFDGVVAYDELLRLTDPKLVTMELDIGWVVTAGADPLKLLTRHADRISALHIKDVRKAAKTLVDRVDAQTTEVGKGRVDWPKLFAAMDPQRIRHCFVEQENFERPALESAKLSFDYLSHLKA
ncbi:MULTISPECIES: sugar phosphate isomerase/epimerase [unclassified Lysobacter]|uniref:sugar phosphate isomerase/epimerase family protein n=1 Tax=unclassified Lysobacter TaxID=2635362 RepID=UPI001BE8F55F|nr:MULTISPECIES: sugar phosphate isomerase/epimerase [unclassified Lysobacter]MBT2744913.1 sugar phosphate isomerase/epimerase [Lysobacter sp. ISL-42]MBT2752094.1 sugar phosphate isomerase/epimerase [Lysobacter sp. ISL-50]MBT2778591.1 sugar phosphate isomerase/epimerase [Lysobacter sp. ISL-54]MBT2780478.1 sugar phosphate isomerase/epimerase [Lysobacter sp. ISL-52]